MIYFVLFIVLPVFVHSQSPQCYSAIQCAAGQCCRHANGTILNAPPTVDFWTAAVNGGLGTCSTSGASEGEKCDANCRCGTGLLCAPNLLCRQCGPICQAEDVVNRLLQYYNIGCTCPAPPTKNPPKPTLRPFSATYKSPVTILNGVVVYPEF